MIEMLQGLIVVAAGVMLGRAGALHVRDADGFAEALVDQRLWGSRARRTIVRTLPPLEIGAAILTLGLAFDRGSRPLTAATLIALGSAFALVIVLLLVKSPSASCGCGGPGEPVGPAGVLRPSLLIAAGLIAAFGAGPHLDGPLADQLVISLSGVAAAVLVELIVATTVAPRPSARP